MDTHNQTQDNVGAGTDEEGQAMSTREQLEEAAAEGVPCLSEIDSPAINSTTGEQTGQKKVGSEQQPGGGTCFQAYWNRGRGQEEIPVEIMDFADESEVLCRSKESGTGELGDVITLDESEIEVRVQESEK